ncbi:MAG: tRNA pseudouridine(55) synthase TruB [Bacteroidales bacterium]|nr:tRNA pseudouridine(55) synthase TruB [Bacteroidales bacterium]
MAEQAGLIIAVDKPWGWTSFQVVNKLKWHLRHITGQKKIKIGHAGTLDPLATGLLLVCAGNATKQIEQLQTGIKVYSGTMVIGATTPCFDMEQAIDSYYPIDQINAQSLEKARQLFVGEIEQVPPSFSAVKVDGQRAYLSARDGEQPNITSKRVTIYDFTISEPVESQPLSFIQQKENDRKRELYRNPQGFVPKGLLQMDFHITCSKGTYIRSIARDFGYALNSGAFLSSLRRERIGDYTLENAIKIDEIEERIKTF